MTSFQKSVQLQVVLTMVVLSAFILQFNVLFPLESRLLPSDDLDHASLLFLPHGLKILLAYLMGIVAVPAIFIAQLLAGLLILGVSMQDAIVGAFFWHFGSDHACRDH